MAITPKALNTLLRVKRRRVEQAEEHVKACQQALRDQQRACDEARQQADACRAEETGCVQKIEGMCSAGFLPSHLIALQHVLEGLRVATQRADQAVVTAQQQVQAAQQALAEARRAVQRAETVVEFLEKRREELLREIDYARDEQQDEESEEAAVARMLAAARAGMQAAAE